VGGLTDTYKLKADKVRVFGPREEGARFGLILESNLILSFADISR
jgi:hypothetical protein